MTTWQANRVANAPTTGSPNDGSRQSPARPSTMARTKKVALVIKCVPPYRYPVFRALHASTKFATRFIASMPWSWSVPEARKTLDLIRSRGITINRSTKHKGVNVEQKEPVTVPLSLPLDLLRFRPDLIISGNMGPVSLASVLTARLMRVPFVLWTEEIATTAGEISRIQKILRRIILPRTNAFLAWGKPAVDYIVSQGFDPARVHYCAQAIDNDWWIARSRAADRDAIRQQLGLKGRVFLLTGQLISRKGFDKLMMAWAKLDPRHQAENALLVVGSGEDEEKLRQLARDLEIPNIVFTGGKSHDELPDIYSAADVLVFPSLVDVWGMVVNEGLACGLPVLASKYAGSSQELITSPEYGEQIDPLDIDSMTATLGKWMECELPDAEILRTHVRKINFGVTVKAFEDVIEQLGS